MSNFFRDNVKTGNRYECKHFTIFEPTIEQEEYLKSYISSQTEVKEGEQEVEFGYELISYVLVNMTDLADDFVDVTKEEFAILLENGNSIVQLLMREISSLFKDISDKVVYELQDNLDNTLRAVKLYELVLTKGMVVKEIVKFFGKAGIKIEEEKALEVMNDPNKLNELLQQANSNSKVIKPRRKNNKKK